MLAELKCFTFSAQHVTRVNKDRSLRVLKNETESSFNYLEVDEKFTSFILPIIKLIRLACLSNADLVLTSTLSLKCRKTLPKLGC